MSVPAYQGGFAAAQSRGVQAPVLELAMSVSTNRGGFAAVGSRDEVPAPVLELCDEGHHKPGWLCGVKNR